MTLIRAVNLIINGQYFHLCLACTVFNYLMMILTVVTWLYIEFFASTTLIDVSPIGVRDFLTEKGIRLIKTESLYCFMNVFKNEVSNDGTV